MQSDNVVAIEVDIIGYISLIVETIAIVKYAPITIASANNMVFFRFLFKVNLCFKKNKQRSRYPPPK